MDVGSGRLVVPAVLCARRDSIYKVMGCDVWDIDRDARRWPGGAPVIAHPPCRAWGELAHMANPRPGEKDLAPWCVEQVRRWGGVLEHPIGSKLWPTVGLPEPGQVDAAGGWTLEIRQYDFGHRAEKLTRLYICGVAPAECPSVPHRDGRPTHVISTGHGLRLGHPNFRSRVPDWEREHTPIALASWLIRVARLSWHNAEISNAPKSGDTTQ